MYPWKFGYLVHYCNRNDNLSGIKIDMILKSKIVFQKVEEKRGVRLDPYVYIECWIYDRLD